MSTRKKRAAALRFHASQLRSVAATYDAHPHWAESRNAPDRRATAAAYDAEADRLDPPGLFDEVPA